MARKASVRWDRHALAWRSDVGPRGKNGRRTPVYFRADETGAEIPCSKSGKVAAAKLLDDFVKQRNQEELAGAKGLSDPTVEHLRLLWLSHVKRECTLESYTAAKNGIAQFCAFTHRGVPYRDRRASTLEATDLDRFIRAKREQGRKPHYLRKLHGVVQAILNWAANPHANRTPERLLPGGNPLRGMAAPDVPASPERFADVKTIAEFLKAWRRAANRTPREGRRARYTRLTALLLRVVIQTGCRPGEACKAEWGDVKWDAGRTAAGHTFAKIVLPPERWKAGRKTGKSRTIRLTPMLTRAIRREYERPDRHPTHLFVHINRAYRRHGDKTIPWTSTLLSDRIRRLRREAIADGVKLIDEGPNRIVAYLFRHTAASRALMRGMDPTTTATLLGTSPDMLKRHYGHLLDGHLDAAAETLARARRGK
jgi:integrase